MKALFELFRRFDARRIFGFIRRLLGMSRPKVKCYDLLSNHALRVEGDLQRPVFLRSHAGISIHALRVEGDVFNHRLREGENISIHALRVEGDIQRAQADRNFVYFYPRPPGGGRQATNQPKELIYRISIHALRVEGD